MMNYSLSLTFLTKESICNLTLETYAKLSNVCVCYFFITAVANYLPNRLLRHFHWMDFFKKHKYNIYDMFTIQIRNREKFDQNLHQITFFNIFFWRNRISKQWQSYVDYFVLFIQIFTQICWFQELLCYS